MTPSEEEERRLARAVHLAATEQADGSWTVTGGATAHLVSVDGYSCDCPDFQYRRRPCKHILAVQLRRVRAGVVDRIEKQRRAS